MDDKFVMKYYQEHDENDYTLLGQLELFNDHDCIVEKVLGDVNLKKQIKLVTVELYTRNEGDHIPHVHVYNDHFATAIRLDTNQYFHHGDYYTGWFNDDQAKIFDKFMREIPKGSFVTRWQLAVSLFNMDHSKNNITIKEQPDYTMLNYTKYLKSDVDNKKKKKGKK